MTMVQVPDDEQVQDDGVQVPDGEDEQQQELGEHGEHHEPHGHHGGHGVRGDRHRHQPPGRPSRRQG